MHPHSPGRHYTSPSSGRHIGDRRLTTNFELWVEIFCVPTCFHMWIPKPCLSVCLYSECPYPEKRNRPCFVDFRPKLVIDIHRWKGLHECYNIETEKFELFSKKFEMEFCPYPQRRNRSSFVNISPTLVIDTSMERSLRVIQNGNRKMWLFKKKKFEIEFCPYPEKRNRSGFVDISPKLVTDTSMERSSWVLQHGNRKCDFIFKKVLNWILSVPRVSIPREKKSLCLRQYQSYISNWYINGKVFTSTTTWKPKSWFFSHKSSKLNLTCILLVLKRWNQHSSRSQHAPICRHRGCIVVSLRVDI